MIGGTVPKNWVITPLDDLATVFQGQSPPGSTYHTKRAGLPFLQGSAEFGDLNPSPTKWCSEPIRVAEQGDILISIRAPVGPTNVADQRYCIGRGLAAIRASRFVEPAFLLHQLRHSVAALVDRSTGTTFDAIGGATLREHAVSLAPLPEQRRIVEALDSHLTRLDDAVASLERVKAKLTAYRASVLKAAVNGRLVPTEASLARAGKRDYEPAEALLARVLKERRSRWEGAELARLKAAGKAPKDDKWKSRYEEPIAPEARTLPELPEGWCWATLPQLGELSRGKSKHRPRNDPRLLGGKYPFVQTGDIRKAETWLRTFEATYTEFGLVQSRLWPAGTLCITIAANIAETAILGFDACFPDSVVGFLQDEPALTRYVEMFLRTARQRLDQYAPATAQKNINLDTLSKVAVPLPPLNEQSRIVEELDRLFSVGAMVADSASANSQRCVRLRQAVLKWAFEGKLVEQDPTDESADELLVRIRAERAPARHAKKSERLRAWGAA